MTELCTKCWHPNLPMEPVDHAGPCPDWAISFEEACAREESLNQPEQHFTQEAIDQSVAQVKKLKGARGE